MIQHAIGERKFPSICTFILELSIDAKLLLISRPQSGGLGCVITHLALGNNAADLVPQTNLLHSGMKEKHCMCSFILRRVVRDCAKAAYKTDMTVVFAKSANPMEAIEATVVEEESNMLAMLIPDFDAITCVFTINAFSECEINSIGKFEG